MLCRWPSYTHACSCRRTSDLLPTARRESNTVQEAVRQFHTALAISEAQKGTSFEPNGVLSTVELLCTYSLQLCIKPEMAVLAHALGCSTLVLLL